MVLLILIIPFYTLSQEKCGIEYERISFIPEENAFVQPRNTTIELPIVFHVFQTSESKIITKNRIYEQLDILNEYFNSNELPSTFYPEVQPFIDNPGFSFCLIDKDLEGNPFSGINFIETNDNSLANRSEFANERRKIKYSDLGGIDAWTPDRIINVWVGPRSDGISGDATFPDKAGNDEDGIVMNENWIGFDSYGPSGNGGMTLVHEMGHYFGLYHIWGDETSCESDDFIDDTPAQERPYSFCPKNAQASCGSIDFIYNIMDFHDDECLRFFTRGQSEMMQNNLFNFRSGLTLHECGSNISTTDTNVSIDQQINGSLLIRSNDMEGKILEISIFSIFGQFLGTYHMSNQLIKRIDTRNFSTGIYIFQLRNDEKDVFRKIFISGN